MDLRSHGRATSVAHIEDGSEDKRGGRGGDGGGGGGGEGGGEGGGRGEGGGGGDGGGIGEEKEKEKEKEEEEEECLIIEVWDLLRTYLSDTTERGERVANEIFTRAIGGTDGTNCGTDGTNCGTDGTNTEDTISRGNLSFYLSNGGRIPGALPDYLKEPNPNSNPDPNPNSRSTPGLPQRALDNTR